MAQSPRPRRSIVATRHPPFVHNRSANPSSATELHAATSPMWSTVGVDGSRRFGRQQLAWNANLAVARELDLPCLDSLACQSSRGPGSPRVHAARSYSRKRPPRRSRRVTVIGCMPSQVSIGIRPFGGLSPRLRWGLKPFWRTRWSTT